MKTPTLYIALYCDEDVMENIAEALQLVCHFERSEKSRQWQNEISRRKKRGSK